MLIKNISLYGISVKFESYEMAGSTYLVIRIKNIYNLWGSRIYTLYGDGNASFCLRKRFLLPVA